MYEIQMAMTKFICAKCKKVHEVSKDESCPTCKSDSEKYIYDFQNSDDFLKDQSARIIKERKEEGLDGLIEGLQAIIINVEENNQDKTITEFLGKTGHHISEYLDGSTTKSAILCLPGSADIIIQSRKKPHTNPFIDINTHQKSSHLPHTRLETFVFLTKNIEKYVGIQQERGMSFLTDDIIHKSNYSFIQTPPSPYTGNSIGFIQWHQHQGTYQSEQDSIQSYQMTKPDRKYLENIKYLDHTATRVRAHDRDAAIIEFMELTNYHFDFAIYVKSFNSITNVARLTDKDFAMVFTSGITSFMDDQPSGPTEAFIKNYGTRVHHLAFHTESIRETVSELKNDGLEYMIDLVGSPDQGLRQIFSKPSKYTLLVNEYIHRYGDFKGFFTKENVTLLTESTTNQ
jgi:4-hydroxyphenylpyruvate dioxygenase-like putative hemolysin